MFMWLLAITASGDAEPTFQPRSANGDRMDCNRRNLSVGIKDKAGLESVPCGNGTMYGA